MTPTTPLIVRPASVLADRRTTALFIRARKMLAVLSPLLIDVSQRQRYPRGGWRSEYISVWMQGKLNSPYLMLYESS